MGLLTHGGEHHEIGDGGWLMMTMATISPLRSPKWTPDLPSRGRTGGGSGSVSKNAMNPSLWFFLPKREYMELELRSVEVQGTHEAGGAPCTLVDKVWVPLCWFFRQYFLLIPKHDSMEFQVIPRTFISAQKWHHGNSAENSVGPG